MLLLDRSPDLMPLNSVAFIVVNGNGYYPPGIKSSPESGSYWPEESCNGYGSLRFSSPGSALSGTSSSILSATSESALSTLSGYSTERDSQRSLFSPNCESLDFLSLHWPSKSFTFCYFLINIFTVNTHKGFSIITAIPQSLYMLHIFELHWCVSVWRAHLG